MGLRFDWKLLAGFDHPLPWALSGGLDPDNVADAIGITGARLVDGPTATDAYLLNVPAERQAAALAGLRASPTVVLAESLDAGARP